MSSVGTAAALVIAFWAGSGVSSQQVPKKDLKTCEKEKKATLDEFAESFKERSGEGGWRMVVIGACISTK